MQGNIWINNKTELANKQLFSTLQCHLQIPLGIFSQFNFQLPLSVTFLCQWVFSSFFLSIVEMRGLDMTTLVGKGFLMCFSVFSMPSTSCPSLCHWGPSKVKSLLFIWGTEYLLPIILNYPKSICVFFLPTRFLFQTERRMLVSLFLDIFCFSASFNHLSPDSNSYSVSH